MRELRPLLLPRLVEEKRAVNITETEIESPERISAYTRTSSQSSEFSSPITPTFSSRGHQRYSSSNSSLTSSPVLFDYGDAFGSSKMPLPDVQEEPHEREDDLDPFDAFRGLYGCNCDEFQYMHQDYPMTQSNLVLPSATEYDLCDGFFSDGEVPGNTLAKKRRGGESTFTGITTRLGRKFPSFSRRRRDKRTEVDNSLDDSVSDLGRSRATSLTRSSMTSSFVQASEQLEPQLPPTPTKSIFDEDEEESAILPIDTAKANRESNDAIAEGLATTPLLPPLMVEVPSHNRTPPVQSPLQSPAIAEPTDSAFHTPIQSSQQSISIPSPPLSSKPSEASFHQQRGGQLVPCSEIPPIFIADPNDEWANKLGHANFNIHPEPYVPKESDIEVCEQFRANWELARCNYMKHLIRTGEHYGVTSTIYKLTEEKWAEVESLWKKNSEITVARASESAESSVSLGQATAEPTNLMKFPSLNDPYSDGKFPKLGDEDIVGPMVQIASQLQRRPSKKTTLMKALQDMKLPGGVFPSSRSRANSEKSR
ncbi:MAG: hypothetical protein M1819_005027 [Sarea resinae]|nr:MAG: hypothetical protein M1819_005027 [Sarea resinae]